MSNFPCTILIADDQRTIRLMMRKALEAEGHTVHEAENGLQAIELTQELKPDVVIMDIVMPVLDGITATKRVKVLSFERPVLVLVSTSLTDSQSMAQAFEAGADDFISKPIKWDELKFRVANLSQRRYMQREIQQYANYDALTGLPNRQFAVNHLEAGLKQARLGRTEIAVLHVSIKELNKIVEALGHLAANSIIIEVAQRVARVIGRATLARTAEDAFCLGLHNTSAAEAARVARCIVDAFAEPCTTSMCHCMVRVAVGIAIYPHDGASVDELLTRAQVASSHAAADRLGYAFYNGEMSITAQERLNLEASLQVAIKEGQLYLHYQPQVNLVTGVVTGVEALCRWDHQLIGSISPAKFIPIAEETGQILSIGRFVIETACKQAKRWLDQGMPLCVGVNLSPRQFVSGDTIRCIEKALQDTQLPPHLLKIEVTETAVMDNDLQATEALTELSRRGVRLSIDDFGTGHSSFYRLLHMPFNEIKIDQSLISVVDENPRNSEVTRAVIGLAHRLGLDVVAEGIETPRQAATLKLYGCQYGQGYHYSRPVRPDLIRTYYTGQ